MIGVLDSGVGGLSIYAEIKNRYPDAAVVYLADKQNFPYGAKSDEELLQIVSAGIDRLVEYGASVIVLACNSATVATVKHLRERYALPIVGIEPAVKQAAKLTQNGKIGVLATHRTTEDHDGESLAPNCTLCKSHHGALVSMIENDFSGITDEILHGAMDPFIKSDVDTVVLGCTHYHFLKQRLQVLYPKISFLEPTEAVVNHLIQVLDENNIEMTKGNDIFLCSADRIGFARSLEALLGIKNADIREI